MPSDRLTKFRHCLTTPTADSPNALLTIKAHADLSVISNPSPLTPSDTHQASQSYLAATWTVSTSQGFQQSDTRLARDAAIRGNHRACSEWLGAECGEMWGWRRPLSSSFLQVSFAVILLLLLLLSSRRGHCGGGTDNDDNRALEEEE